MSSRADIRHGHSGPGIRTIGCVAAVNQTARLHGESEPLAAKAPQRADFGEPEAVALYLGEATFAPYWPFPTNTCHCPSTRSTEKLEVEFIWLRKNGEFEWFLRRDRVLILSGHKKRRRAATKINLRKPKRRSARTSVCGRPSSRGDSSPMARGWRSKPAGRPFDASRRGHWRRFLAA